MTNTVNENIKYYEEKKEYVKTKLVNKKRQRDRLRIYQESLSKWQQFKEDLENKQPDNDKYDITDYECGRKDVINEIIGVGEEL